MRGRLDRAGIDGDDWDDDAGEEEGGQLVDVFDAHENHHGHETKADGAVDAHVVQHGAVSAVVVCSMKDGGLRYQILLRKEIEKYMTFSPLHGTHWNTRWFLAHYC